MACYDINKISISYCKTRKYLHFYSFPNMSGAYSVNDELMPNMHGEQRQSSIKRIGIISLVAIVGIVGTVLAFSSGGSEKETLNASPVSMNDALNTMSHAKAIKVEITAKNALSRYAGEQDYTLIIVPREVSSSGISIDAIFKYTEMNQGEEFAYEYRLKNNRASYAQFSINEHGGYGEMKSAKCVHGSNIPSLTHLGSSLAKSLFLPKSTCEKGSAFGFVWNGNQILACADGTTVYQAGNVDFTATSTIFDAGNYAEISGEVDFLEGEEEIACPVINASALEIKAFTAERKLRQLTEIGMNYTGYTSIGAINLDGGEYTEIMDFSYISEGFAYDALFEHEVFRAEKETRSYIIMEKEATSWGLGHYTPGELRLMETYPRQYTGLKLQMFKQWPDFSWSSDQSAPCVFVHGSGYQTETGLKSNSEYWGDLSFLTSCSSIQYIEMNTMGLAWDDATLVAETCTQLKEAVNGGSIDAEQSTTFVVGHGTANNRVAMALSGSCAALTSKISMITIQAPLDGYMVPLAKTSSGYMIEKEAINAANTSYIAAKSFLVNNVKAAMCGLSREGISKDRDLAPEFKNSEFIRGGGDIVTPIQSCAPADAMQGSYKHKMYFTQTNYMDGTLDNADSLLNPRQMPRKWLLDAMIGILKGD